MFSKITRKNLLNGSRAGRTVLPRGANTSVSASMLMQQAARALSSAPATSALFKRSS